MLEHSTATCPDGTRLAIQVSGHGPALLLLPGQANSHDWWNGIRDGYASQFTTVTFDYRGTGDTIADEDVCWTMRTFADDALVAMDSLGFECFHIFGTSMGGRIAQVLAGTSGRVTGLVLGCTSPGRPLMMMPDEDAKKELRSGGFPAVKRLFYTPAWDERGVRSHLMGDKSISKRAAYLHRKASDGTEAAEVLDQITCPTLIMHGVDDRMTKPENSQILHEHIAGSRLILSQGRHGFFDEFAADVTPVILDFLAAIDA